MANNKKKKKTGRNGVAGQAAPKSAASSATEFLAGKAVSIDGAADFWAAVEAPGLKLEHQLSAANGIIVLESNADLEKLLSWFQHGVKVCDQAKLKFPSSLGKDERAHVHQVVSDKFAASLETFSSGVGDDRSISVCAKGMAQRKVLTSDQESQVDILYKRARDFGLVVSKDELRELVLTNSLTEQLQSLWNDYLAVKRYFDDLHLAAREGSLGLLKECLEGDAKATLNQPHPEHGAMPLHTAAAAGQVEVVKLLIAHGADLEAVDGKNNTALENARRAEQCDVEAVLLQSGASDPEKDKWSMPEAAAKLAAGEPSAAAAAAAAGTVGRAREAAAAALAPVAEKKLETVRAAAVPVAHVPSPSKPTTVPAVAVVSVAAAVPAAAAAASGSAPGATCAEPTAVDASASSAADSSTRSEVDSSAPTQQHSAHPQHHNDVVGEWGVERPVPPPPAPQQQQGPGGAGQDAVVESPSPPQTIPRSTPSIPAKDDGGVGQVQALRGSFSEMNGSTTVLAVGAVVAAAGLAYLLARRR